MDKLNKCVCVDAMKRVEDFISTSNLTACMILDIVVRNTRGGVDSHLEKSITVIIIDHSIFKCRKILKLSLLRLEFQVLNCTVQYTRLTSISTIWDFKKFKFNFSKTKSWKTWNSTDFNLFKHFKHDYCINKYSYDITIR